MKICRDWDRRLQLFSVNEEFQVSVSHQLALITSLPFVHTARRYLGLRDFEKLEDRLQGRSTVYFPQMRIDLIEMS